MKKTILAILMALSFAAFGQPLHYYATDAETTPSVKVGTDNPLPIANRTQFFLAVAKGQIAGHSTVHIEGHNPDIDSATFEDLWEAGGLLVHLASAETMNIVSTDIDDDGDPADTGCRTLKVEGVDGSYNSVSETVTMNGTSNVLTTQAFLAINFLKCITAGTSSNNEGTITATASSAGTVQAQMDTLHGISQDGFYTVPAGHTFFLAEYEINAAKISGGGTPLIEIRGYGNNGTVTDSADQLFFDKRMDTAVDDEIDESPPTMQVFNEKSFIHVQGNTDTANTEVRIEIYGILVQDGY
jgi:hypothetical protein